MSIVKFTRTVRKTSTLSFTFTMLVMASLMQPQCASWMMAKLTLSRLNCAHLHWCKAVMWSECLIAVGRKYKGKRQWEALKQHNKTRKFLHSLSNLTLQKKTSSSLLAANPQVEFPKRALSPPITSSTSRTWLEKMSLKMDACFSYYHLSSIISRIMMENVSIQSRRLTL